MSKIINKINRLIFQKNKSTTPLEDIVGKTSYSQCGEDLLVQYVFNLRGLKKPSYIDIGANHPYSLSNTAIFYLGGCRGINIEANPNLIGNFLRERPEDVNLNIGIGSEEGEFDFYIMNDPTLCSFSKVETEKYESTGLYKVVETKSIQVTTIQKILEKYAKGIFPDFLSLDAEGMDYEILKTINYNENSPKVICVEAAEYSPVGGGARRSDLINFLINNGYYEFANTNLNAILVKNSFWIL
jgi:FkbM family methyltransferase